MIVLLLAMGAEAETAFILGGIGDALGLLIAAAFAEC